MFRQNGYVYIEKLLTPEECVFYAERMFNTPPNNNHVDTDHPLSDNYYNIYRDLLENKMDMISSKIGINLLPCFSYSRIYRTGDLLDIHKDREGCEISVSITLGFKGEKVWPIHMLLDNEIKTFDIHPGDGLVMDGMNYKHWRDKYVEGQWQAQVFLHYVDAKGPYVENLNDVQNQKKYYGNYKVA